MKRIVFGQIIGRTVVSAFLLIGCDGNNPTGSDNPEFGNLTGLGEGKTYVAYAFSDKWKKKLDTVSLSFECNSAKVKSISVTVTIDSGKTWLPVGTVEPNGSNSITIRWVPKTASGVPKYFGGKQCFFRIADTTTDIFIESDTFPLLGTLPMILLDALDNRTFRITDSIKVQYGVNMDLVSNLSTFFKTESMKDWVEFANASNLSLTPYDPTILNLQKCLIPDAVTEKDKQAANYFKEPIKILIKDYGPSQYYIETGYLTVLSEAAP